MHDLADSRSAAITRPRTLLLAAAIYLLAWSVVGGLIAAAATYYVFGRGLSNAEETVDETLQHPVAERAKGVLDVINRFLKGIERIELS